jgi:hypothetical protein
VPRYDVVGGIGRWGTPAAVDTSRRSDRQGSRAERLEVLSLLYVGENAYHAKYHGRDEAKLCP